MAADLEYIIVVGGSSIGSRYTVYTVPPGATHCHPGRDFINARDTLWGAKRAIRKDRKRRRKYGNGRIVHREAL